jgi:hypothetical protein
MSARRRERRRSGLRRAESWGVGTGPNWAARLAGLELRRKVARAQSRIGPEAKKEKGVSEKENILQIFKRIETNEFKHKFEFNQTKIVLQHECNKKLLWFINLIKKNN